MDILTLLGVIITLAFVVWLLVRPEILRSEETVADEFHIISYPSKSKFAQNRLRKTDSLATKSFSVAGFHAQRKEGEICWQTGMLRDTCPCKKCVK